MVSLRISITCLLVLGLSHCQRKSDVAAKEIIEAGYTLTAEGWFSAIRNNDVAVIRRMVQEGFDARTVDSDGYGALYTAVTSGNKEAGDYLLDCGLPINEAGAAGRTPLMAAVISDHPEMVKWLLLQGSDPKLKEENGFTALMIAVKEGRDSSVVELAPYHREDLDSALLLASLFGKAEVIDALTSYGASVYARMEDGRTPLMLAAMNGHREAAVMLIEIGASRFATLDNGDSAQSLAVEAGHPEIAELIEEGYSGDILALESDEQVAKALDEYLNESHEKSADNTDKLAAADNIHTRAPWNRPISDQSQGRSGIINEGLGSEFSHDEGLSSVGKITALSIDGARIGNQARNNVKGGYQNSEDHIPLVMRHYRQRELPVKVKRVSGGVASLHIAGSPSRHIDVKAGDTIPSTNLLVKRAFIRTEQGKLNNGMPIKIGIIEVEDLVSGQKMEWSEGRPAAGHDPVALVEDTTTGQRYLAKSGQKFTFEDGRIYIVNDVRPGQIVIENTTSGEVQTLSLRGPKG